MEGVELGLLVGASVVGISVGVAVEGVKLGLLVGVSVGVAV